MTWESPTATEITLTQPSVLEMATNIHEPPTIEFEKNRAAVKLERLTDKVDLNTSHDDFLRKCIENKVIPLSYQVFSEPRIGNHDENFLKAYHDSLSGFSNQVMKYTAKKILPISKHNKKRIKDYSSQLPPQKS